MADYKTPGVYVKEISKFPPSVAGVATAVPAFIGFSEKTPFAGGTDQPVKVTSLLDFESKFGVGKKLTISNEKLEGHNFVLYDSIRLFYDNGGGTCYIVSIGDYSSKVDLDRYQKGIDALEKIDEVTLLLFPDAAMLLDSKNLYTLHQKALSHCKEMGDRFAILDLKKEDKGLDAILKDFRDGIGNKALSYGAAYYPYLFTTYRKDISFDEMIKLKEISKALEGNPLYNDYIGKNPGEDPTLTPKKPATPSAAGETEEENRLRKEQIAKALMLQIPGYADILASLQSEASIVPPSGAIAGIYAATDNNRGVWQAPANISISSVSYVTELISDKEQEDMNVDTNAGKSINAIRFFSGKGILVWGARTLDGNSNEWRFIPVRRLFNYIEESVQKSTNWVVFQPNDANTWVKVQCQIENFLSNLWRDGALAGSTPEAAFYVKVGLGVTMKPEDILEGKLIVEIGVAAVRPAEFIVLKFSHKIQEA